MPDAVPVVDSQALWVPMIIFAHLYSFFFLFRAWVLTHPGIPGGGKAFAAAAVGCRSGRRGGIGGDNRHKSVEEEVEPNAKSGSPDSNPEDRSTKKMEDAEEQPSPAAVLYWRALGCTYRTAEGPKAVLRVGMV